MSSYSITTGILNTPVKVVLYGPEGIGKSTFASHFPDPVFIDTEGGTKRLNVARLPQPTSWAMLLDEVRAVTRGEVSCGTLVIDTADWAERLAIDAICAKAKVDGLEGFGYGKGYTYVKEEFGRLLDALEEVLNSGHHVLILAHAAITKFEQPDAAGSYDRWTMKTTKQTEPLLREWCDHAPLRQLPDHRRKERQRPQRQEQSHRRQTGALHHPPRLLGRQEPLRPAR